MGSQLGALFGGIWGDAGQNFVDLQGGPDKVFGTKPKVAPFTPIDLSAEIGKATDANLANYDSITALLNKYIPNFSEILQAGSTNTLSELKGEIPADVEAAVMRNSAYKSLQGGFSGTGMSKALTARDLGLTSLNLTEMGKNSAQVWANYAETGYSPFVISAGQQASTTAQNNAGIQANEQFKFNVAAAPDPGALGTFNLDTALGEQMLAIGGALGGAAMGGSGAPAGAPPQTASNTLYNSGNTGGYTYDASIGRFVPANSGGDWRTNATWGGGG